jgi:tetratricopeptide (TPR) repeat protein
MKTLRLRTSAGAALTELSALCQQDWNTIDAFTLARLERTARGGLQTDPVGAHQVLAIVAAVRWDDEEMDNHFGAALRIKSGATIQSNYATALDCVGRCSEAADMYERAAQIEECDLSLLRRTINANWRAGRWMRALEMTKTLMQRAPGESFEDLEDDEDIVALANRLDVSHELIEKLHSTVHAFLRERKIWVSGSSLDFIATPGEECIYVAINVCTDRENAVRLDRELTPVLFDSVDDLPLGSFHIYIASEADHAA